MPTVRLPVAWLSRRRTACERCTMHGRVATEAHRVRIARRPAGLLAGVGGVLFAMFVTLPTDPVVTPLWAFCPECRDERSLRVTAGGVLCASAAFSVAALYVTAPVAGLAGGGATLVTVAIGIALLLGGLGLIAAGAWPVLCGGYLSRNGSWLIVDAHEAFVAEVNQRGEARGPRADQRLATRTRVNSTLD